MQLVPSQMEIRVLIKERNALVAIKKDISVETGSVQCLTELEGCALLLAISELNVPELVSVVVVAPHPEGIKVAKVLMMEEEILGVDEVTVEEDMVVVMEGRKKQTLGLTGITAKNLPDRFIVPSLHLLWSS